jgi:hypothetical protein
MTDHQEGPDRRLSGRPVAMDAELDEHQSLVDVIHRVLDRGVVLHGDVTLSVAGVDLVYLGLNALLTSVSTARQNLPPPDSGAPGARLPAPAPPRIPGPAPPPPPRPGPAAAPPQGREAPASALLPTETSAPQSTPEDRLAAEIVDVAQGLPARLDIDPDAVQRDLARLVLTIVELLRRVVEHQAVRRMDDGDLTDDQIERMGSALLQLEEKLHEIKKVFGVADHELNIDLGPLGKLL